MAEQPERETIPWQVAEAPVSWNVFYTNKDGFNCQLTLRGQWFADVLKNSEVALKLLAGAGATPRKSYKEALETPQNAPQGKSEAAPEEPTPEDSRPCPLPHGGFLTQRVSKKTGDVYMGHVVDGKMCFGK